jgi:hypothetical protein
MMIDSIAASAALLRHPPDPVNEAFGRIADPAGDARVALSRESMPFGALDQRGSCRRASLPALALAALWPMAAAAEGALAVGMPADVAKQAIAIGHAVNYATRAEAEAVALEACRRTEGAPQSTRDLCKVISSFTGECFAIALDPEEATPGVGWEVAATRSAAQIGAMARCRYTAGARRQDFCQIAITRCDGQPP